MRHIAVNFYESFHSTDWAEREYHYLSTDNDLEYGEILAVYTRHGISIARFRRYLDESDSHAESYVAKRLNIKVTGETNSLVEDTKKDILLENLDRLTKRKETIRLAELYAENDKDISNLLSAYKDLGSVSVEDEEGSTQEESMGDSTLVLDKADFSDERFEGVSIHEGEISYRYIEENKVISVFYVNTNEDIADLKEKLIESGATLVGETRTEHLSQLSNGEAFIVYTELSESRFKFFSILTLDSFKEQPLELQAIPFHYRKEKTYVQKDVVKNLSRLTEKYSVRDSLMGSILSEHLSGKDAIFLDIRAQEIKDHNYDESTIDVYVSIKNETQKENVLLTSQIFVHTKTITRDDEDDEEEIDEMIADFLPSLVDSIEATWTPLAINTESTQSDSDSVDLSSSETRPTTSTDMEELKYLNFISLHEDLLDTTSPKGTIINKIDYFLYSPERLIRKAYIHVDSQEEMSELLREITSTGLSVQSETSLNDDVLLIEESTDFDELKLTTMSLDDIPDEYQFAVFEDTSRLKGSDFNLSKVTPFINHSSYGLCIPVQLRSPQQQNRMTSALNLKGYSWLDGSEITVEENSFFEDYVLCIYLTEKYVTKKLISNFDKYVPKPIHQID